MSLHHFRNTAHPESRGSQVLRAKGNYRWFARVSSIDKLTAAVPRTDGVAPSDYNTCQLTYSWRACPFLFKRLSSCFLFFFSFWQKIRSLALFFTNMSTTTIRQLVEEKNDRRIDVGGEGVPSWSSYLTQRSKSVHLKRPIMGAKVKTGNVVMG